MHRSRSAPSWRGDQIGSPRWFIYRHTSRRGLRGSVPLSGTFCTSSGTTRAGPAIDRRFTTKPPPDHGSTTSPEVDHVSHFFSFQNVLRPYYVLYYGCITVGKKAPAVPARGKKTREWLERVCFGRAFNVMPRLGGMVQMVAGRASCETRRVYLR